MFYRISIAALLAIAPLGLSGCLENTGVAAKAGFSLATSQTNCLLPDAASVKNLTQKFAASAVTVGGDFCAKPTGYDCNLRVFSPTATNGQAEVDECAHVAELGGDVCFKVKSFTFSTRDASRASGVSATALQPGGEFNRLEYQCSQHDLFDGSNFLAVGEADSLKDALAQAFTKCSALQPRLTAGN
jgi:hypothetical protein